MTTAARNRTVFTIVAVALGVAGGFLLARRMPTVGEEPPRVLLDMRLPVDSMGALFAFTLDRKASCRERVYGSV